MAVSLYEFIGYQSKLDHVRRYFSHLHFKYDPYRGWNSKSFLHDTWILYNLIEIYNPKKIYGRFRISEKSIVWRKGFSSPQSLYRWGFRGEINQVIDSVIPSIKLVLEDKRIIFIGCQNSFTGYRPDLCIYAEIREIKIVPEGENKINIFFDNRVMASIIKKERNLWHIEEGKYRVRPNIIVEVKESKGSLHSGIKNNIKKYKKMFPDSKLLIICPERIEEEKLNGCYFIRDTFKEEFSNNIVCDKDKFQKRLGCIILQK